MDNKPNEKQGGDLPACAAEFIRQIGRRMRYRKRAAKDVQAELTAHFEDELRGCTDVKEREQRVQRLISEFGDARLLAVLCRRAKKRCRPLWAKAIVRTAQGAGVMLILFVFYATWFLSGKPAPRMDYVAMLNQMSRPEIADKDNAWPHYEKAFAALVEPNDELELEPAFKELNRPEYRSLRALPEATRAAISQWVENNEAALREFKTAAAMSYCLRSYRADPNMKDPWVIGVLLPHLSSLRNLGRLGIWRSGIDLEQGDTSRAADDCLTVARAGRHWQRSEFLIEQLVGLALSWTGHEGILAITQARRLPPADLANLQQELAALYLGRYPLINIEAERLQMMDTIQHVFTEGGPGGGHMPFSGAMRLLDLVTSPGEPAGDSELIVVPMWTALSLVHAGRCKTTAKANWLFDEQAKSVKLSPYERRAAKAPGTDELLKSLPEYRYAVIHILAPALDRVAEIAFRGKALHEATMTVLALQRYRQEKGAYPASLEELKRAGYIDALPADPYGDGPLTYKPAADQFTLYSVGPDFKDDGGTSGTDRKGRPQMWDASTGDAVFWPVSP
jgi:hypothetical protein